ncbi:MAG: hypothetical protein QW179_04735, partial [Candidatus Hadarchaeales archaeon]
MGPLVYSKSPEESRHMRSTEELAEVGDRIFITPGNLPRYVREWPFTGEARRPFREKYKGVPIRWQVEERIVSELIEFYEKKLDEALLHIRSGGRVGLPSFFRNRRTDEEYIYDLIDGWLVEDIIYKGWLSPRLKKAFPDVQISLVGTDKDRVIEWENPSKITTRPDFKYSVSGKSKRIELQMAREERDSFDMKETKIKRALKEGDIIYMWVIIPNDRYFLLDPKFFEGKRPTPNPNWGGKKVFTISRSEVELFSLREE